MTTPFKEIVKDLHAVLAKPGIKVLAVSGGVDSIFLLDVLRRQDLLGGIRVVHFNHLLGQRMDDGAEAVVRRYCSEHDIQLNVGYGDSERMLSAASFESDARKQRYAYFLSFINMLRQDSSRGMIITAHNLYDQVENILLGMCRGVPVNRTPMARLTNFVAHNVSTYRPLLGLPKPTIIRMAKKARLEGKWEDDYTNEDVKFERNFMRHAVIPLLCTRRNVYRTIPKSVPTPPVIDVVHGTLFDPV